VPRSNWDETLDVTEMGETSKVAFVTEIPIDLKTLVSCVSRGFYPYEYAIVMDYLIYYPCLKEDDMVDLLKYDRKQLRAIMANLKNDKLVKTKIRLETSADGKSQRHNYYFINYQVMVNVIKYKLDHMRRKIESEELVSTNRASFVCTGCGKTFTDLEVDQLIDHMSGILRCTYCGFEVEEEGSDKPQKDSRSTLVKFNEQFQRLFDLLSKVENIKLSAELLDPEPTVLSVAKAGGRQQKARDPDGAWSGDATRSSGIGFKDTVTINYDEKTEQETEKKERLAWMEESTVSGSMAESVWKEDEEEKTTQTNITSNKSLNQDIINTLLVHEKKGPQLSSVVSGLKAPGAENDSDSDSDMETSKRLKPDDDVMEDEDDDDDIHYVSVGGVDTPLDDVDDDAIARMSQQEKDAWIQLTQKLYADAFD